MKYFLYIFILLLLAGSIYLWDASWRYDQQVYCPEARSYQMFKKEIKNSSIKDFYQNHVNDSLFRFPRKKVAQIVIIRNKPVFGRLFQKPLNNKQQEGLLHFLNNQANFSWHPNKMSFSDAGRILIFYDQNRQIIGKLWLCASCGSIKLSPFAPATKYGKIKRDKIPLLLKILE